MRDRLFQLIIKILIIMMSFCGCSSGKQPEANGAPDVRPGLAERFEENSKWRATSAGGDCVLGRLDDQLVMTGREGTLMVAPLAASPTSQLLKEGWQVVEGAGGCFASRTTSTTAWSVSADTASHRSLEDLRKAADNALGESFDGASWARYSSTEIAVGQSSGRPWGTAPEDPFLELLREAGDGDVIAGYPSVPGANRGPFWYVIQLDSGRLAVALSP